MNWLVPALVALFGCLITAYVAMIHANIRDIKDTTISSNDKLQDHMLDSENHAAGFARLEQQVLNVLQTAKIAHERIDRLEVIKH